ncbi:hypothetical protein PR202_gb03184 [Eleusine coracana subsp. coracana]|uniref:FAD/NAD(P)-binding domain-containing protein n=1 Tax=Eleusine coracana subsp. coracana TaxID=191504 RepID=A0AAV5E140_ELECO|nr:hypothetical protein PR202_gb03184 [Eleusine coracana subsp. coracana]
MDSSNKKRVAIIGAGPSGLAACKHALAKGFVPVIFDSGASVGGVWTRTLASTKLQTPAAAFQSLRLPLAGGHVGVPEPRPSAGYSGASEKEVTAWDRWSGNGEAFGDGSGEWHLTVEHIESGSIQKYEFDFLIVCVGRTTRTWEDHDAAELIRGKRVVVVGSGKSGLDTAAECAEANGSKYPCTLIYRTANWMVDHKLTWGLNVSKRTTTRLAELMVHKPEEGFALSLLATLLTPLRWLLSTVTETYYKMHIPMRKNGMVPDCTISQSLLGWKLGLLPDRFYDLVDEGSLVLNKCDSFSFCADGLVLDSGKRVEADVVILATGFNPDQLLRSVFTSPWVRDIVSGASSDTMLPLYRQVDSLLLIITSFFIFAIQYSIDFATLLLLTRKVVVDICRNIVHPRIPQMAIVGYLESRATIYPYEMMSKWVAHLLDGTVRLPSVKDMEKSVGEWALWGQGARRRSGSLFLKSCIATVTTWYHDQLCRDMGYSARRKKGFVAELMEPYGPTDYADIQ